MSLKTDLLLLSGDPDKRSDGLEARLPIPAFEDRLQVDRATNFHLHSGNMNAADYPDFPALS